MKINERRALPGDVFKWCCRAGVYISGTIISTRETYDEAAFGCTVLLSDGKIVEDTTVETDELLWK